MSYDKWEYKIMEYSYMIPRNIKPWNTVSYDTKEYK